MAFLPSQNLAAQIPADERFRRNEGVREDMERFRQREFGNIRDITIKDGVLRDTYNRNMVIPSDALGPNFNRESQRGIRQIRQNRNWSDTSPIEILIPSNPNNMHGGTFQDFQNKGLRLRYNPPNSEQYPLPAPGVIINNNFDKTGEPNVDLALMNLDLDNRSQKSHKIYI